MVSMSFCAIAGRYPKVRLRPCWGELRATGRTTEAFVEMQESHLAEMGFAESPSDK